MALGSAKYECLRLSNGFVEGLLKATKCHIPFPPILNPPQHA